MKSITVAVIGLGAVLALSSCTTGSGSQTTLVPTSNVPVPSGRKPALAPAEAASDKMGWPRQFNQGSTNYWVYPPQIDSWDGHLLKARHAVAIQFAGQAQPVYGVIDVEAITLVDKPAATVTLADIKIDGASFPSAAERAPDYLRGLSAEYPKHVPTLSLDLLEASLAAPSPPPRNRASSLNNTPPKILVSTKPAMLVYIDGVLVYRPIAGTDLERVINTRVLLLKDRSGRCYLHWQDGYLEAASLDGPWSVALNPPLGDAAAEKQARDSNQVDLLQDQSELSTNPATAPARRTPPVIYVATAPTELITFDGESSYIPIVGTQLLYATNTSGNVFKLLTDQQIYLSIAGRWFRAPSMQGPWKFVPGAQLPRDFAQIPDNSPKENVKASVPGAPQASEALIANSIPQSTQVPLNATIPNPHIDGTPQLKSIEGTPLSYVVNSATPIIRVNDHSWYACQDGVWYTATTADGPWTVAASVPDSIYAIPPSSPLHYVTYVHVYRSTPNIVYEGYTPGYLGTEVTPDGTVVYGTGYTYAPWIGDEWYGPPLTWGFGFGDCWAPGFGWCFDCGFGWSCGYRAYGGWNCHPLAPWWGPCGRGYWGERRRPGWGRGAWGNTAGNLYPGRGVNGGPGHSGFAGHAWPGNRGFAYNSRTGEPVAGQGARVQGV